MEKKKRELQHVEGGGSVHQRAPACTGVPWRAQACVCAYMHKVLAVATHQLGFGVHGGYVSRGAGAAVGGSLHAHHVGAHGHLPLHLRNNSGTDILTSKLGLFYSSSWSPTEQPCTIFFFVHQHHLNKFLVCVKSYLEIILFFLILVHLVLDLVLASDW